LWCLRVLLILLCSCTVLFFFLYDRPFTWRFSYDFGDCSFILLNAWKVGCICSTVIQTKFTITNCIHYVHHRNIVVLTEIPFLNRLDIYCKLHLLLLYCVVFCNYDLSRVILDVWMCKQDMYYSAISDLAVGFDWSSCCNVFFFCFFFVLFFALFIILLWIVLMTAKV
jgi:hypothetical protein